jgi:hypothetical protein
MPVINILEAETENREFQASLGYMVTPCLKKQQQQQQKTKPKPKEKCQNVFMVYDQSTKK